MAHRGRTYTAGFVGVCGHLGTRLPPRDYGLGFGAEHARPHRLKSGLATRAGLAYADEWQSPSVTAGVQRRSAAQNAIRLVSDGTRPGLDDADRKELREVKKRVRLLEQENEVLRRAAAYLSQANLPGK